MENNQNPQNAEPIISTTTTKIDPQADPNVVAGTIENKANETEKPKRFLTKKRVILTIVFLLISLGFVLVTFLAIVKVDWKNLWSSLYYGMARGIGVLWLILMLLISFIDILRTFITLMPRLEKLGCHISFGDYLLFGITSCFLCQVTPATIVLDPYTIFWMKTHGLSTSTCTSVLFSSSFLWQVCQIVITFPMTMVAVAYKSVLCATPTGKALFALMWIGLIIDFITLAFIFFMCVSKKVHYFISKIFNWLKKKLHMKYHTKAEIEEKYKEKAVMKNNFYSFMKDWKTTLIIFGLFVAGDVVGIIALPVGMYTVQYNYIKAIDQTVAVQCNFGWAIVCARLSVPINRLNFLPGQAMGFEAAVNKLLEIFGQWKEIPGASAEDQTAAHMNVIKNGILMTKVMGAYLPALIGIPGFIILTKHQIQLSNQGKLLSNANEQEGN